MRAQGMAGLVLGAAMMAGCQTSALVPAQLAPADAANVKQVRDALRAALGRTTLELGPIDTAAPTVISVLPPPPGALETHSLAIPAQFDVMMQGAACYAVDVETDTKHLLKGVTCTPG